MRARGDWEHRSTESAEEDFLETSSIWYLCGRSFFNSGPEHPAGLELPHHCDLFHMVREQSVAFHEPYMTCSTEYPWTIQQFHGRSECSMGLMVYSTTPSH